jgi:opacity protein-like surface antigen
MRTCGITWRGFAVFLSLAVWPAPAMAEWHIKPFLGLTFAGGTTFVDSEKAAGVPNVVYGASGLLVGDFLGIEGDFGRAPGFFQRGNEDFVLNSSVTTLTGSFVVAMPRQMVQYSLRPYLVAGAGMMHVEIESKFDTFPVSRTLSAMNLGGGVTGFVNDRIGLSWEVRYFRSISAGDIRGVSVADEKLSFWRANMAVVVRY